MNLRMFAAGAFVLSLVATSVRGDEPKPSAPPAPPASVAWTDSSERVAKADAPLYLQVHVGATGRLALRSFSPATPNGAWADLGEWSLSGEPKAQMDALKGLHSAIGKAIAVPALPPLPEEDGQRALLLIDAESTAPWRSVQWVVATAASPQTKVYRVSFLTSVPGEALDIELRRDGSEEMWGPFENAVRVDVRMFRKGLGGADEKPWTRIRLDRGVGRADPVAADELADRPPPAADAPKPSAAVEFRIVVLSEEQYALSERGDVDVKRSRHRLWAGSDEEFRAFKEAEVARWRDALSMGVPYVPSRPAYRLVPRRGASAAERASSPRAFAVVEEPTDEAERFGGHILAKVSVGKGEMEQPVTTFEVKPDYQAAFETWTARNVGMPMAIIVKGEYRTAPRIISALRDRVQVTLGQTEWDAARREAEELRNALQPSSTETPNVSRTASGANTFDLPLAGAPSGVHAARWHEVEARIRQIAGPEGRRFAEIRTPPPSGQAVPYADVIGVMRLLLAAGCETVNLEGAAAPLPRKDGGGWGYGR
jgi:hypothetical protein